MRYIVTGANRGIGLEFVKQLAGRGEEVWATARRPDEAEELTLLAGEHEGRVHICELDVADADSVGAFVAALEGQPVDVLINNAGMAPRAGDLGELDYEGIRRGFEVNAIGPLRLTEALLEHLRAGEGKRVMSLTSRMGSIEDNGSGGSYGYRASKAALNMCTRSLARDLHDDGIVAFVIHPGWVQTDMGGPRAKISTEESVAGMLEVLDGSSHAHTGRFMNWDGAQVEW